MNGSWAVCIKPGDRRGLAALRGFDGIEVAESEGSLWARAARCDEAIDRVLRTLPGCVRYNVLADGQLVLPGRRVPGGQLPTVRWTPLADWLQVKLPPASLPGQIAERASLRLVRTAVEQPAGALVTSLPSWADYCTTAAEIRLRPLAFAVADDARVFVIGAPLPPLPGERYVVRDSIALPCGFELAPRIGGALLRRLLKLDDTDIALFAADGSFERIAHEHLVAAGRAAARATVEALAHD
ncbi:MAG TPA: hypothetical protein VJ783_11260 [Pirellulales bacterium]|nr:hypothetical protein [Pirellulales bacterium]